MKKLIYGGLFLALVGIGFVGCEKNEFQLDSEEISNKSVIDNSTQLKSSINIWDLLEENPEMVGVIHNETLSYVYDQLFILGYDVRNNMTKEELMIFCKDKSIEYLTNYTGESISYQNISDFFSFIEGSQDFAYDQTVQSYVNQLYIGKEEIDLDTHIEIINYVLDEASQDSQLTSDELNHIIAIASVAKKSHQYWKSNSISWYSLFNLQKAPPGGYKGRVIDADISGAVKGAIGGFAGSGGNPLGGLVGGMFGAPVSSAWQGIVEWWNS